MGKLINCNFKGSYDTNFDDNVLDDFYIPALSASTSYDRMTGFFSSSSLACAARGIKNLIENGGKMRILTSPYLTKEDVKLIESQYSIESSNAILTECMSKSLSISEIEYDNVQALGWLLKNNLLDIRVVLVHDENGELLDADSIDKSAMFHNKIGIFKESDTIVTFNGSINETLHGWIKNIESFEVFCNWKAGFDDHGLSHIMRFESYWKIGSEKRSKTIAMPEAIKRKLIVGVPDNKYDLKIFKKEKREKRKGKRKK